MFFFNIFKRKPKLIDELFGDLTYNTVKDPSKNYYSGKIAFHSHEIGIIIEAGEGGPSKEQREFFIQLRDNYPGIKASIIHPFLKREFDYFLEKEQITDLDKEFTLDSILIPHLPASPIEWDLTYDADKMRHWITVYFKDLEPQGYNMDG